MLATKRSAGVARRGDSEESIGRRWWSMQGSTYPGFEIQCRSHKKFKTGESAAPQQRLMSSFFKILIHLRHSIEGYFSPKKFQLVTAMLSETCAFSRAPWYSTDTSNSACIRHSITSVYYQRDIEVYMASTQTVNVISNRSLVNVKVYSHQFASWIMVFHITAKCIHIWHNIHLQLQALCLFPWKACYSMRETVVSSRLNMITLRTRVKQKWYHQENEAKELNISSWIDIAQAFSSSNTTYFWWVNFCNLNRPSPSPSQVLKSIVL